MLGALSTALINAQQKADANERRLLTAQDAPLVDAVAQALRELGFEAQDMDQIFPVNDRREDLRVTLKGEPSWMALCEVNGYFKGAKVGDLLKMVRFRGRFIQEQQRPPDRCWYVVNCYLQDEPTVRGVPLSGNVDEVQTFAEDGGLVLSTVDLFRLLMATRAGRVSPEKAQALLRTEVGVFHFHE